MKVLNVDMSWRKMKHLFQMYDQDGNGMIDHREFCSTVCPSATEKEEMEEDDAQGEAMIEASIRAGTPMKDTETSRILRLSGGAEEVCPTNENRLARPPLSMSSLGMRAHHCP